MALRNLSAALKLGVGSKGRIEGDTVVFDPTLDEREEHSVFLALRIAQTIDGANKPARRHTVLFDNATCSPADGEATLIERYRTQFGKESRECYSEFLWQAFDAFRRELEGQ